MVWTLPKTWNVGDVLTSTDMNTYVRDNSGYLYGDTAQVLVTNLVAGFSNYGAGFQPLSVRKVGSLVWVSGVMNNNSGVNANGTFATVPSSYAPAYHQVCTGWNGNGSFRWTVMTSGALTWDAGAAWASGNYAGISGVYSLV